MCLRQGVELNGRRWITCSYIIETLDTGTSGCIVRFAQERNEARMNIPCVHPVEVCRIAVVCKAAVYAQGTNGHRDHFMSCEHTM